jgi:excinuclease UvrABC nuclease subunit
MFSCIIAKHAVFENLQLGLNIQPRHQPIENIRSRQLVSYPFILLSMV